MVCSITLSTIESNIVSNILQHTDSYYKVQERERERERERESERERERECVCVCVRVRGWSDIRRKS